MQELAKKICIYNGMRGTDKQVMQCIKSFGGNYEIMLQFAKGRIKL